MQGQINKFMYPHRSLPFSTPLIHSFFIRGLNANILIITRGLENDLCFSFFFFLFFEITLKEKYTKNNEIIYFYFC